MMPSEEPLTKRIKVRKGTFSCWECKRRKKKCITSTGGNPGACDLCLRMGYQCTGQEYIHVSSSDSRSLVRRLENIEGLAALLVGTKERQGEPPSVCRSQPVHSLTGAGEDLASRSRSLNGFFYSKLPHPFVAALILQHGKAAYSGVREPLTLSKTSSNHADELDMPANFGPACLARKLIRLAVGLMYMDAASPEHVRDLQLADSATETARQYVGAARHLTSRKELLLSSAGLEAVMMEGHYCVHLGQIEAGGVSFRRAMHIARAIGLPKKAAEDDDGGLVARMSYLRLTGVNRSLSLNTGENCEEIDDTVFKVSPRDGMAVEPSQRLSYLNIQMWRRIIARNVRIQHAWKCGWDREAILNDELLEALHMDREMKQVTLLVPSNWWQLSNTTPANSDDDTEANFTRLNTSKDHFNTVVLIHLPYVLHASTTTTSTSFIYSKSAAVSASREVLLRFPIYQQFQHVPASYRAVEQKAFVASVVLLLAHMHSHQSTSFDAIEHERPKDLNVLAEAITSMEKIFSKDRHYPQSKFAPLLRRMMEIEEAMAAGSVYTITCSYDAPVVPNASEVLDVQLPYFGNVRVEPDSSMPITDFDLEDMALDDLGWPAGLDQELGGMHPAQAGESLGQVFRQDGYNEQCAIPSVSTRISANGVD